MPGRGRRRGQRGKGGKKGGNVKVVRRDSQGSATPAGPGTDVRSLMSIDAFGAAQDNDEEYLVLDSVEDTEDSTPPSAQPPVLLPTPNRGGLLPTPGDFPPNNALLPSPEGPPVGGHLLPRPGMEMEMKPRPLLPRPGMEMKPGPLLPRPGMEMEMKPGPLLCRPDMEMEMKPGPLLRRPDMEMEMKPGPLLHRPDMEMKPVDIPPAEQHEKPTVENVEIESRRSSGPPIALHANGPPGRKPFKPIGLTPHGQRILANKKTKEQTVIEAPQPPTEMLPPKNEPPSIVEPHLPRNVQHPPRNEQHSPHLARNEPYSPHPPRNEPHPPHPPKNEPHPPQPPRIEPHFPKNDPEKHFFQISNNNKEHSEEGEISEQSTDELVPDFVKGSLVTEISEENKSLPLFLLCPLCRELLLDPLVLPCFHAICGTKCIPKLTQDGYNVWCPQCKSLQKTKYGIDSLQPAETFGKMSRQIREKQREEAIERGEITEEMDVGIVEQNELAKPTPVDDLTCRVCNKIFALPVRLPCSHSICKFPCAYKTLKYNFKIVCPVCDRPTFINGGIYSLPISEDLVTQIKAIKGENYLEDYENKWREFDEGPDINNEENNIQDNNFGGELNPPLSGEIRPLMGDDHLNMIRLKNFEETERKQAIPSLLSLDLPPPPSLPKLPEPKRPGKKHKRNSRDFQEMHPYPQQPEFHEMPTQRDDFEEMYPRPQPRPPGVEEEPEVKPLPIIPDEDLLYAEEPIAAEIMGISWSGPKRCRAPVETNKKKAKDFGRNDVGRKDTGRRGNQGGRQQGFNRNRNQDMRNRAPAPSVRYEGGMIIKDHNHQSSIPSLLDGISLSPRRDQDMVPHHRRVRHDDYVPHDGYFNDSGMYESAEIPGQEMVMNNPESIIAPMLASTGSGPPPIVNYESPVVAEPMDPEMVGPPVAGPSSSMPMVVALPPGSQPAPTSLPVMDPSTIPTMNSAFEYQAHWTKFVQQTMAYYNSIYAAQGGTPPEAQTMINDYLAKCWAWYSAFTNLCQVNPEYKDSKVTDKKPKENKGESGEQETKAEARKKKKKNKNKAMKQIATNPAAPDVNDMDPKEIEELKIMLLKKQLELKVKHARNKSELRDLLNMKKLVLEEEGEEKVEEIDEEEREKVKEAAKQKQLEREKEIERQEKEREKDRDKEILRLQEEREREREREYERERQREMKERERQRRRDRRRERDRERERLERERRSRRDRRDDYHDRRRGRSRSRSRSSSSGGRSPPAKKPVQKEEAKDEEPKYIKVANLPDDIKAVDLKGFVENFGQVLNCKIGKMQGEMIAVVYMASLADAMSCVRDMHGSHFKGKILEVKYMVGIFGEVHLVFQESGLLLLQH